MAPRFKQLLFQTYAGGIGASAFIGFPVDQIEQISRFRESLCIEFEKNVGCKYRTDIVGPYNIDVNAIFFDDKNAEAVNSFYSKPRPGFISWLFHRRQLKEEESKIKPLIKIEITTSHDYPCVTVEKSVFTEDTIAQLIENVADNLNLSIVRSRFSVPMSYILMSNKSFDAKGQIV